MHRLPGEWKSSLRRPIFEDPIHSSLTKLNSGNHNSKPNLAINLPGVYDQPNQDSLHLDRTAMSVTRNELKLDHSSSWPAAILQWHSTHSDAGPPSSVSISVSAHTDDMASGSFPTTPVVIVYIIGFVIAAWIILCQVFSGDGKTAKWDLPWVPAVTRRDAAAMPFFPVFLLLPATLWPLVVAAFVLVLIVSGLWLTLGSATSCCGIPLPNKNQAEASETEAAPDLEMGAVAGGEDGGAPGGGEEVASDRASELSSASAESEGPPPYASVAPDEDGEGETDGLLAKGTR